MGPTWRRYRTEEDYWRVRPFLREVFLLNGRREVSWTVARWDYWRWPGVESWGGGPLEEEVFLWELPDGRIAAVLNAEGHGHAFLQVHPGRRTLELEAEMLEVAEQHLATPGANGRRRLCVWADAQDRLRQDLLTRRSYARGEGPECQHRRSLSAPIPDVPVAEGYTVRALGDLEELPARSWFSWKAFHPDEPEERYTRLGWKWYLDIQRCPLYRRDLDLVASLPDGTIAALSTFWFDDVTRTAYIEPVATVPEHQRKGLARALITEGLRRVQRLGAERAFVGGYEPGPDGLYSSVLSPVCDRSEQWLKEW